MELKVNSVRKRVPAIWSTRSLNKVCTHAMCILALRKLIIVNDVDRKQTAVTIDMSDYYLP